jgi:ABC-type Zn uptake system ZnuABC Zn-binding protein ZnuA
MLTRRLALLGGVMGVALALAGCSSAPDVWKGKGGPPRVVVSFPPLYSFVREIGGDHVGIISLCTNTGPHHYHGTTLDAGKLRQADLFFAIGMGFDDDFTDTARINSGNPRLKETVKLGDRLPKDLKLEGKEHDEHEHGHAHKHDDHHPLDPHVWLGIPQAKNMIGQIRDRLKEADPAHAADYDANAKAYAERLDKLQADGKKMLAGKKDRRLISFHESLTYFAESFGLEVPDIVEKVPGEGATAQELKPLIDRILKEKITVLALEPQYPKEGAAQVIVDELKKKGHELTLIELDPMETADEKELDGGWYERTMRENLEALEKALP